MDFSKILRVTAHRRKENESYVQEGKEGALITQGLRQTSSYDDITVECKHLRTYHLNEVDRILEDVLLK